MRDISVVVLELFEFLDRGFAARFFAGSPSWPPVSISL